MKYSKSLSGYTCSRCSRKITTWIYRYQGDNYCRFCYEKYFKLITCSSCNKNHHVLKNSNTTLCKFCQVKNKPCIRCKKESYRVGKITRYGIVCNSCSKYYKDLVSCSNCHESHHTVSNRKLIDGNKLLCQSCYYKHLSQCDLCKYYKLPYISSLDDKKTICKKCYTETYRSCNSCKSPISAGVGNICHTCRIKRRIESNINFLSKVLTPRFLLYFILFIDDLTEKSGIDFLITKIKKYSKSFIIIDNLYRELERIPSYKELISLCNPNIARSNSAVFQFLHQNDIIIEDETIKKKYSDITLINKHIEDVKQTIFEKIALSYFKKLIMKYQNNEIKIITLRLAISSATNFFIHCNQFQQHLSQEILDGYLWIKQGQRNSLVELINYINKIYNYDLIIKDANNFLLKRSKEPKKYLQYQLKILLTKKDSLSHKEQQRLIKLSFAYFHSVVLPNYIIFERKNLKNDYISLGKQEFYLPSHILSIIRHIEVQPMYLND